MASKAVSKSHESAEPAWDIASLFPPQGAWSEEEYLALDTNRLVEFAQGRVEVLPMPTDRHQAIVAHLYLMLLAFSRKVTGTVRFAPLRVRLSAGKYREPDLVFLQSERDHLRHEQYWEGADLVIEVVSTDNRALDLVTKRREYAWAGITEYWIVDPQLAIITVLTLAGDEYVEHGQFGRGEAVTSAAWPELQAEVSAVLDAT